MQYLCRKGFPAFVGFDLLYLSICLLFFNIPLLVISIWAAVMLHLQALQEEEHMKKMFGEDYINYMEHTLAENKILMEQNEFLRTILKGTACLLLGMRIC